MAADLVSECANYERLMAVHGGIGLQLLGIGQNGHLGFNEPLSAFRSRTRVTVLARATRAQNAPLFSEPDAVPQRAITMGVGSILDCRGCVLLATGSDKAAIVAKAVEGPITSMISATALQLHPHCTLVLDEAAAGQLKETEYYCRVFEEEPECAAYRDVLFSAENNGLHVVADSALDNEPRPTREKVARLPLNGDEAGVDSPKQPRVPDGAANPVL
jgi:glucosamine-6-phosphate deaminase